MRTTIETLSNFNKHLSNQCTSLQEYKISKEFQTMAESQAKFHSQQILKKMNQSLPNK